jgi:DNA (cytosine-5)-methyltransferase 1
VTLRHGSLCTGFAGLDLAAQAVFGGELAWWSDIEPGPIKVMQHHHPDVPNLGDFTKIDWKGGGAAIDSLAVDVLTAGYP